MSSAWLGFDDEDDLLNEFEKMLNGEANEYEEVSKKTYTASPEHCFRHTWEKVGYSPVLNDPWYNCSKCGLAKEEYDKRTTERPLL